VMTMSTQDCTMVCGGSGASTKHMRAVDFIVSSSPEWQAPRSTSGSKTGARIAPQSARFPGLHTIRPTQRLGGERRARLLALGQAILA
jgi:hypothetical protein